MIGESELILNDRGAIYHLDLRPEEIADTIIIVGDPDRVHEVSKYFVNIELTRKHREFITHTGYLAGKRLTVVSTGIGTDNIDIVLNELDALVNIDLQNRKKKSASRRLKIIRIGTSGSLRSEIPVDSFVISEYGIGLDNLLNFYHLHYSEEERNLLHAFVNHVQKDSIRFIPYMASCSNTLRSLFSNIRGGITVTCPGFYGPQGRMLRAQLAYPKLIDLLSSFQYELNVITNFEMETSGIYGLSKILGHEAVSLNAIVANRKNNTFSKNHEQTIDNLIRYVLEQVVS